MGDKRTMTAEGRGQVELCINMLGNQMNCLIQDVLYGPDLEFLSPQLEH